MELLRHLIIFIGEWLLACEVITEMTLDCGLFRLALPACPWQEQQEDLVLAERLGEECQLGPPCLRHQLVWLAPFVELGDHPNRYVAMEASGRTSC